MSSRPAARQQRRILRQSAQPGLGRDARALNSRRVAAHGLQGSAVDVNQIPFAAIERVEVLKEGASAIYGTDAIGGVINFILRKDYQGLGVQGFVDATEEGDHTIYRGSAIAGYGDLSEQGFNVMAAVSYSDIPELRGDQRDFVNTFQPNRGLSPDTRGTPFATIFPLAGTFFPNAASTPLIPGTTRRASGGINVLDLPGREGCGVIEGQGPYDEQLWTTPEAAFACAWDTGRAAVLQQPLETLTYLARGVVRLGEHELTAEATGSDARAAKRFSNVQITPNTTTQNYAHPVGAPGYDLVYTRLIQPFPNSRRALARRSPTAGAASSAADARSSPTPRPPATRSARTGRCSADGTTARACPMRKASPSRNSAPAIFSAARSPTGPTIPTPRSPRAPPAAASSACSTAG
jgi:iron complex outermembrane receptor protein